MQSVLFSCIHVMACSLLGVLAVAPSAHVAFLHWAHSYGMRVIVVDKSKLISCHSFCTVGVGWFFKLPIWPCQYHHVKAICPSYIWSCPKDQRTCTPSNEFEE